MAIANITVNLKTTGELITAEHWNQLIDAVARLEEKPELIPHEGLVAAAVRGWTGLSR